MKKRKIARQQNRKNVSFVDANESETSSHEGERKGDDTPDTHSKDSTEIGFTRFNMSDEKEDGEFDASGHFVWKKQDRDVQEDQWLSEISDKQIEAARIAKNRQEFVRGQSEDAAFSSVEEAKKLLYELLRPNEDVLTALKRFGRKKPQKNKKTPIQTPEEELHFNQITDAAAYMMQAGQVNVYSQAREDFKGSEQTSNAVLWEYKGIDGQIHGPFPSNLILQWRNQGYFTGASAVYMRQAKTSSVADFSAADELLSDFDENANDSEWVLSDSINFEKYL